MSRLRVVVNGAGVRALALPCSSEKHSCMAARDSVYWAGLLGLIDLLTAGGTSQPRSLK
ncbi:hypothetical protein [Halolamina sp.]|uniref:hypothetical protein n=1 Tax=Halolamina sp. TaxID=1940283 RepID=UPI003566BED2